MLRRPVKYNPDKRDFLLTETALNNFLKQDGGNAGSKKAFDYDMISDVSKTESSISYGNRCSKFGFTDMFGLGKSGGGPTRASATGKKRSLEEEKAANEF